MPNGEARPVVWYLCPVQVSGPGVYLRLAILMLDHLHPWGDAESIYRAARAATSDAGAMLVGVSYNEEHPLAGRLRLYRSVPEVLSAIRSNQIP